MAAGPHLFIQQTWCKPISADTVIESPYELQLVEETKSNHRVWEDSFPLADLALSLRRRF